ncbi:flavodoxin family protein [Candidatus Latescibacterota bacterium]
MKIIAIAASPRKGGNSETLLDEVIKGLEAGGAEVIKIRTSEYDFIPCLHCGGCDTLGRCVIDDSFQEIFDLLVDCDGMVFSSPLYFMNVPARGKALIDRCQSFWAAKFNLKRDLFEGRKRIGLLVGCSGKKYGLGKTPIFRGIEDTMSFFFIALDMESMESLLIPEIEFKGDIDKHPTALTKAKETGKKMVEFLREKGVE